jgi:hypothetical protein
MERASAASLRGHPVAECDLVPVGARELRASISVYI